MWWVMYRECNKNWQRAVCTQRHGAGGHCSVGLALSLTHILNLLIAPLSQGPFTLSNCQPCLSSAVKGLLKEKCRVSLQLTSVAKHPISLCMCFEENNCSCKTCVVSFFPHIIFLNSYLCVCHVFWNFKYAVFREEMPI